MYFFNLENMAKIDFEFKDFISVDSNVLLTEDSEAENEKINSIDEELSSQSSKHN